MTIGKYPSIGIDCRRSIIGVSIKEAILFVAARIPNETPQSTEIARVMRMREIVLKVKVGKSLSSEGKRVMINQVMMNKPIIPTTKLTQYLLKSHSPTWMYQLIKHEHLKPDLSLLRNLSAEFSDYIV
jgi:hypothetical protein